MTKFEKLLIKSGIDINSVVKNDRYRTYRKWITGEITDPRISSIKIFMDEFKDQYEFSIEELVNCFEYGEQENDDFIITITSNWLPRRNLSVIKQLLYTKYYGKKVLVVNATPYGDLTNEFGIDDSNELKIMQIDMNHIPLVQEIEANIYKSQYDNINLLNLISKNNESIPLAEKEKSSIRAFRQVLSDLQGYDNIIVGCSNNPIFMTRVLGAVANSCITFDDALPKEYGSSLDMYHTVKEFNDKFIILDVLNMDRNSSCNHDENYLNYAGKLFGEKIAKELK